jgi:hypothetical protein
MNIKEVKDLLQTIIKSNVTSVKINHPEIKLLVKKDFYKVSK